MAIKEAFFATNRALQDAVTELALRNGPTRMWEQDAVPRTIAFDAINGTGQTCKLVDTMEKDNFENWQKRNALYESIMKLDGELERERAAVNLLVTAHDPRAASAIRAYAVAWINLEVTGKMFSEKLSQGPSNPYYQNMARQACDKFSLAK